ncbi:MAG: hypothetical protein IPL16_07360 [Ignavibacteria bacterium]|nr:hypothetical protein [Ignavibacteria bacterium]
MTKYQFLHSPQIQLHSGLPVPVMLSHKEQLLGFAFDILNACFGCTRSGNQRTED